MVKFRLCGELDTMLDMEKPQTNEPHTILSPQFSSLADIERAITELRAKANDLLQFQQDQPRFDDKRVESIQQAVKIAVAELFGPKSPQFERFRDFAISPGAYMNMPRSYIQQCFDNGFSEAIAKLEGEIQFLNELKAIADGLRDQPQQNGTGVTSATGRAKRPLLPRSGGRCLTILKAKADGAKSELLNLVIKPVLAQFNYSVDESELHLQLGKVTQDVLTSLRSCELVVVDLTDASPIAFYELGIRHASGKPTIHMMEKGGRLSFDPALIKPIEYSLEGDGLENVKRSLLKATERLMI